MYVTPENVSESLSELLLNIIERNGEISRLELENIMIDSKPGIRAILDFFIKYGIVDYDPELNTVRLGRAMEILR